MKEVLDNLIQLIGYSEEDASILKKYAAQTAAWQKEVTQVFNNSLYGYTSTSAVFWEGERPASEDTLHNWYKTVTEGAMDDKFWRGQWFVGLVNSPHSVTNPFMPGMMSRVQQVFLAKCRENLPTEEVDELFGAFKRATDVIAFLIAKGYFHSYVQSMEHMSGQSEPLFGQKVNIEVEEVLA